MPKEGRSKLKRSYSFGASGKRRTRTGSSSLRGKDNATATPSESIRSPKSDLIVSYAIIESSILQAALESGRAYDKDDAIDLARTHHRDGACNVTATREAAFVTFRPITFPDDMHQCMSSMPTRRRMRSKSEREQVALVKGLCQCHLRFLHLMPVQSQVYLVSIRDDDDDDEGADKHDDEADGVSQHGSSSDGDDGRGEHVRRYRRRRQGKGSRNRTWHFLVKWDVEKGDWHRRPLRLGSGNIATMDFNSADVVEFIGLTPVNAPSTSYSSRRSGRGHGSSRSSDESKRVLPTRLTLGDSITLSSVRSGSRHDSSFLVAPYNLMAEYNDEARPLPQDLKASLQDEWVLNFTSKLHMRHPRYSDLLDYGEADWHKARTINHGGFGVIMTVPWRRSSLLRDDDLEGYTEVVVKISRESKRDSDGEMKKISHFRRLKHALCEAAYALAVGDHPSIADDDDHNYQMNHSMKTAIESFAKCYGWFIYGDGELAIVMERLDVDLNRALGYRRRDKKRMRRKMRRASKERRIKFEEEDDYVGAGGTSSKTQAQLDDEEEELILNNARRRCTIGKGHALKIVYAMTHALLEMHDGELFGGGFVHRDIKPHNIMLNADGEARIIDFSFCIPMGSKSSISSTYLYSPPPFNKEKRDQQEQQEISGKNDSHHYDTGACDWYALAVTVVNDIDPVVPLPKSVYTTATMLLTNIADYGEDFDASLVDKFVERVDEKYFKRFGHAMSTKGGSHTTSSSSEHDDSSSSGEVSQDAYSSRDNEAYATDEGGWREEEDEEAEETAPTVPYRGASENEIEEWWRDQRGESVMSVIANRVSNAASSTYTSRHEPTNGRQSWRASPPVSYN